jgi:hypothetical protein
MAYDEGLAERLRDIFRGHNEVEEKKMFGGLCFMVSGHMCCGIVGDRLMARVGHDNYQKCLSRRYASEMDFTGKPMKGFLYVDPGGISEDEDLTFWVRTCLQFIESLPPRK